ncbi:MAG: glycosyltransferase family 2 protein [Lachnospiraceae bacterium]|uniref:Glycosyltransferase family 2 protein n=1 Tax=Candidatus Weimeria bifida TaxID=2599074 RepID=A0A6N7J0H4_9FIRM|nr:glycosyltransferase family 2 protein [Candidatus Weimeria bifida]RRF96886.1 MAG: glycosyltransferase family 2 protein [Lachnospiraceae bacterium]
MPEISIITPVYNAGPYLKNTITSVFSQRFSSYEWLICDDGSTDDSAEILSAAAVSNPNIHVFTQENHGVSAARNTCLRHINGRYLMYLDADDTLETDCLSKLHEKMSVSRADLCIYGWNILQGEKLFSYVFEDKELNASPEERYEMILKDPYLCGGGYPWNKIWRVDSLGKIPFFDENLHHYEDKLWTLQCLDLLASPTVTYLTEPLYDYYLRYESLSHPMTGSQYFKHAEYTLYSHEALLSYIKKAHPQALKTCVELVQNELTEIKDMLGQ